MENQNPQELTQAQAVNVLIQAARIAQSKGAFTIEDAEIVSKAIKAFTPPQSETNTEPTIDESSDETVKPVLEKV